MTMQQCNSIDELTWSTTEKSTCSDNKIDNENENNLVLVRKQNEWVVQRQPLMFSNEIERPTKLNDK